MRRGQYRHDPGFEHDIQDDALDIRTVRVDGRNDTVYDELADVGYGGRQHTCDEGQECEHNRQRSARRPDQPDGPAAVAEHAEEPGKEPGVVRVCCRHARGIPDVEIGT